MWACGWKQQVRNTLAEILRRFNTLEESMATQAEQLAALQQADDDIKQAVADVGDRVLAKVSDLEAQLAAAQASSPQVDAIIQDLKDEGNALAGIAPADQPQPTP